MFRLPPRTIQIRVLLLRKIPLQTQICCISRLPPLEASNKDRYNFRERDECPKPPPCPPPPRKKRPWIWQLLGLAAATAAFTVYAHDHPKVRDWLSMNAPWFDDWIAFAYQENTPFPQAFLDLMCDNPITAFLENMRKKETRECIKPELVSDSCLPGKEKMPIGPKTEEEIAKEKEKELQAKAEELKEGAETGGSKEPDKQEMCNQHNEEGGKIDKKEKEEVEEKEKAKMDPNNEKKVALYKEPTKQELAEMSRCVGELTQCVRCNVGFAKEACMEFNEAADNSFKNYNTSDFNKLECKMDKRKYLVHQYLEKLNDPRKKLKDTATFVNCAIKDPKVKKELQDVLSESNRIISEAEREFEEQRRKSKQLIKKYYAVKPAMDKLIKENKMLIRGLDYEDTPQYYFDGDLDLLLQHTLGYKRHLTEQLATERKYVANRAEKAFNGLACDEKGRKENMYKVEAQLAARRAEIAKDINNRYDKQKKDNEEALQKALKEQKEKFDAKTAQLLADKEEEANEKLKDMVAEKVDAEREKMRKELDAMRLQLQKIEDKLNAKLKAEDEIVKAQSLYAAGSSLLAATQKGVKKRVCVNKELNAIEKSGQGDELVTTVLQSIPPEVHKNGIITDSALRHKFSRVEEMARKVALVEREGSPLPVYLASWLQSMMLSKKMITIPQEELNIPANQPINVEGMDTFDIISRARFWMDHGNLARALEYVEKLEGASKAAADRWYKAARAHLETKQAAHAVIAHAANINLKNI